MGVTVFKFPWDEDGAVDLLKARYAAGDSAAQTARALTVAFRIPLTRNAVIGKLHRLGICNEKNIKSAPSERRGLPFVSEPRAMPKPTGRARMSDAARQKFGQTPGQTINPSPAPREITADVAIAPKPWIERRTGRECAWPIDGAGADTRSCCNPTGGKTYCETHAKIMVGAMPKSWAGFSKPGFAKAIAR